MTIAPSLPLSPPRPKPEKDWTVLVWAASDNNLYPWEINDLDKMERVANPDINLLATVSHRPNPDPQGPHSVQRLELAPDQKPGLHSPVKAEVADGNMANPDSLADFVRWGIKNYPAKHYWLVISDHGDAWHGACEDEGHQAWMSLPGIERALFQARQDTGRKLDMVSFDCCYMASAEVAHQLKDEARYLVASEEAMGYGGLDYDKLLPEIQKLPPREAAQRVVAISGKDPEDIQTFAAIDLERIPALTQSLQGLGQAIVASPQSGAELKKAVEGSEAFWGYRDVFDLADRLGKKDPTLQAAATQVKGALQEAVIAERHHPGHHPRAHGLQIEVNPEEQGRAGFYQGHVLGNQTPLATSDERYQDTAFDKSTGWSKVIAKLSA